jgi:hypothetical protein
MHRDANDSPANSEWDDIPLDFSMFPPVAPAASEPLRTAFRRGDIDSFTAFAGPQIVELVWLNMEALIRCGVFEEAVLEAHVGGSGYPDVMRRMFAHADRERLRALAPLPAPGPFVLYRGVCGWGRGRNIRGFSWTGDLDQARWFAGRHVYFDEQPAPWAVDPAVYLIKIGAEHVAAYCRSRHEDEYVVLLPPQVRPRLLERVSSRAWSRACRRRDRRVSREQLQMPTSPPTTRRGRPGASDRRHWDSSAAVACRLPRGRAQRNAAAARRRSTRRPHRVRSGGMIVGAWGVGAKASGHASHPLFFSMLPSSRREGGTAMRTRMVCSQCLDAWTAAGLSTDEINAKQSTFWAPITSAGVSVWTCPAGHKVQFWLQTPFYSLLYSKALTDLARMDTRSAVMSFYSAWENFVAYTATLLLQDRGVAEAPSALHRAEPQLGMFAGLVAFKAGQYPKLPQSEITEIRNKVAHGSYVPDEAKTLKVGQAAQQCIRATRDLLKPLHEEDDAGPKAAARAQRALKEAGVVPAAGFTTVGHAHQFDADIAEKVRLMREEHAAEHML